VHQVVSKKRPKSPKLDIPFGSHCIAAVAYGSGTDARVQICAEFLQFHGKMAAQLATIRNARFFFLKYQIHCKKLPDLKSKVVVI
jgi:hypothetical protein